MLQFSNFFFFSEQFQILHQYIAFFNGIVNAKINYKTLSDVEQDIHSYMVFNEIYSIYIHFKNIIIPLRKMIIIIL